MSAAVEVVVPDIGDFTDVPVVEVLVAVGDEVAADQPLVVLESDKASMEIPAPQAGHRAGAAVAVGDTVSEGTVVAVIAASRRRRRRARRRAGRRRRRSAERGERPRRTPNAARRLRHDRRRSTAPGAAPPPSSGVERGDVHAAVLVLGSGPGGYAAAFRAADLGLDVVMVERYATLGGVCLNVGCIPSKALLHVAKVIAEAEALGRPRRHVRRAEDRPRRAARVEGRASSASSPAASTGMAKTRKVRVVHGEARFTGPHMLEVDGRGRARRTVSFDHAIIAAARARWSCPASRTTTRASWTPPARSSSRDIPERLLVIGGGIIGLEMATVYDALGSQVTVVELADQLIPGCDPDLVKPLQKRIAGRYEAIHLGDEGRARSRRATTACTRRSPATSSAGDLRPRARRRRPRARTAPASGLDAAGVDRRRARLRARRRAARTNVAHIYAIGDVAGQPMLAHKATHEGHVAAEVIAGHDVVYDVRAMPVGRLHRARGRVGRAHRDRGQGERHRLREGGVPVVGVGPRAGDGRRRRARPSCSSTPRPGACSAPASSAPRAGELVAEVGLAIEMGADVGDIALTVHAHPTLSETVGLAAEIADGTITDLPNPAARATRRG